MDRDKNIHKSLDPKQAVYPLMAGRGVFKDLEKHLDIFRRIEASFPTPLIFHPNFKFYICWYCCNKEVWAITVSIDILKRSSKKLLVLHTL